MASLSSSVHLLLKKSDMNRPKNIKNVKDVGIPHQQKAQKQGRDDSIKQFSTQLHPTYL